MSTTTITQNPSTESTLLSTLTSALRSPPGLNLSTSSLRDYEPTPAPPPSPVDWQDSPQSPYSFADRFGSSSIAVDSIMTAEDWVRGTQSAASVVGA